jgi:hypothetical protein
MAMSSLAPGMSCKGSLTQFQFFHAQNTFFYLREERPGPDEFVATVWPDQGGRQPISKIVQLIGLSYPGNSFVQHTSDLTPDMLSS